MRDVRLPILVPLIADADSTVAFELTGCDCNVPLPASVPSAVEKLLMVDFSVVAAEICAVSLVVLAASAAFLAANCAWTSEVTREAVSTPEPVLSDDRMLCAAFLVTFADDVGVGVGVGVLVVGLRVAMVDLRGTMV